MKGIAPSFPPNFYFAPSPFSKSFAKAGAPNNCIKFFQEKPLKSNGNPLFSCKLLESSDSQKIRAIAPLITGVASFILGILVATKSKYLGLGIGAIGFSLFATGLTLSLKDSKPKTKTKEEKDPFEDEIYQKVKEEKEASVEKVAKKINKKPEETQEVMDRLVRRGKMIRTESRQQITYRISKDFNPIVIKASQVKESLFQYFNGKDFTLQDMEEATELKDDEAKGVLNYFRSRHKLTLDKTYRFLTQPERASKKGKIAEALTNLETRTDLENSIKANHEWEKWVQSGNFNSTDPENAYIFTLQKELEEPSLDDSERLFTLLIPFVSDASVPLHNKEKLLKALSLPDGVLRLLELHPKFEKDILTENYHKPLEVYKDLKSTFIAYFSYLKKHRQEENFQTFYRMFEALTSPEKAVEKRPYKPN